MSQTQPQGFLAAPAENNRKGVLVLHPWWGLNDTIKSFCNDLAAAGYTAFAPDLYHGQVTDTIEGAEALSSALFTNLATARQDAAAAAVYLQDLCGKPHGIAALGFSMGAFMALDLSIRQPEIIRSVVTYYGTHPGPFSAVKASYLCHFAEQDDYEPQDGVDEFCLALQAVKNPVMIYQYPGTEHWFAESNRSVYNPPAAKLAWGRTLAFLQTTL